MYADDTTVYCIGPNVDQVMLSLNKTMEQVFMWSIKNQLTIHPIKTEAMILSKTSFVGPIPPLYFNTGHIDMVNYTTCLGVKIDNRLTWKKEEILHAEGWSVEENENPSEEGSRGNML